MITTTAEFTAAANAKKRRPVARVTLNFTDVFLDPSVTASATSENRITQTEQAANSRTTVPYKYAAASGSSLLNGTFHPAPSETAVIEYTEVGWWGGLLSDDTTAEFSTAQDLQVDFASRKVTSFLIQGDDKRQEFPVDFDVKFYDSTLTLIHTESVTGNTEVQYNGNIDSISDIERIILSISKWSHINEVAKIVEFSTAVVRSYDTDEIISFSVTEERDTSNSNSIPTGNIAASEADITLNNAERDFDANNTESPIYGLVKPNVKVTIEAGFITSSGPEYVTLFNGWSDNWDVPETDITASVAARDRLDLLTNTNMTSGQVQYDQTIYDLFEDVFQDAGLADTEYEIDIELDEDKYIIPISWFENVTHRSALTTLAESCSASVYVDRAGLIQVQAVNYFSRQASLSTASYDRSDYSSKNTPAVYDNISNKITVTTQPLAEATGQTVYETLDTDSEEIGGSTTETYTIYFDDAPIDNASASISPAVSGVTITDSTYYSWGATLEVTNTNSTAKTFLFTVTGSTFSVQGSKTVTRSDSESINNNGEIAFNYDNNSFLQARPLAVEIAEQLLISYKDPQRDMAISFEPGGNPAHELGDLIRVTDRYTVRDHNIIKAQYSFRTGLSCSYSARSLGVLTFNDLVDEDLNDIVDENGNIMIV